MTDAPDPTSELALQARGIAMGEQIWEAVRLAQANAPRTLQSESRVLGMSDLGACREYIRATVAGEERWPGENLKLAAYMGTAGGDKIEADVSAAFEHAVTQHRVTLVLEVDGQEIRVSGSADLFLTVPFMGVDEGVLDLKSRDGLSEVRREGASFKEKVQISGYLTAAHQEGLLDDGAIGVLFFYDRSGKDRGFHTWTVDLAGAARILEAAKLRLAEVVSSLATGRHAPRDEPESWCWQVQCPFYYGCWAGYTPTEKIEHEREIAAVDRYVEARAEQKAVVSRLNAAKVDLEFVSGVTPDGTTVAWTELANGVRRIDVREPK